jgi:nucleotide-binding universal stress UspA family protein
MLRTIVVPLDGSPLAERALDTATALSIPTAARLVLVRVEISYSLADIPDDQPRAVAVQRAEHYLAEIEARLIGRGFIVQSDVRCAGRAPEAIVAAATEHAADMIVMTSHGRTGPTHLLFGSVAEGVVAHSPIPVLVERVWQAAQRELLIANRPRLLVPLDGTELAEAALEVATGLADDLDGELVLLNVEVPDDVRDAERDVQVYLEVTAPEERFDPHDYLARTEERLSASSPDTTVYCEVRRGRPADQIVTIAHEVNAALIVMATHGRTGVDRMIAGSVAGRVIEHAQQPVVLIRPGPWRTQDV